MSAARSLSNEYEKSAFASVSVTYRNIEGYHTFTSEDVRGLYVSSKDPRRAFSDVALVIKELVEYKIKKPCLVEAETSYEEWLDNVSASVHSNVEAPLTLGNKRFLVREYA